MNTAHCGAWCVTADNMVGQSKVAAVHLAETLVAGVGIIELNGLQKKFQFETLARIVLERELHRGIFDKKIERIHFFVLDDNFAVV